MFVVFLIFLFFFHTSVLAHYSATITNDGPVVLGANITFQAKVFKNDVPQEGTFKFKWRDNMKIQNKFEETRQGHSTWKINHSAKKYDHGNYEVQVGVYIDSDIFDWSLCYASASFTLEDHLVGELILQQDNQKVGTYINSKKDLQQVVQLHGPDFEYLSKSAYNYDIKWWIDSQPFNSSKDLHGLMWHHKYQDANVSHTIGVSIVAIRNESNSNSSEQPSTEVDFIDSTNSPVNTKFDNATDHSFKEKSSYSTFSNITNSDACKRTQVCGSFSRRITVKAPVENVNIIGNNWLKHGDMLNLRVTCNGSAPFQFCVRFYVGTYKVKGNETCKYPPAYYAHCDFSVPHYFRESKSYTVLLIVRNDVHTNITAVGVNIYEVTKHPQLSVVVVPLTASILAIILIIFGVAFYFQNRNSLAIEVADFDFTNNNELEYKTFKERLAEAIHNAFNKPEDFSEEDSYNEAPSTSNKKYGSMQ